MIIEALKYPFKGERAANNIIIGTLLIFASIFVLPIFILVGYFARTVNNSVNGKPAPEFKDYKGLFVDGIKLTAVFITYFAVLIALMLPIVVLGNVSDLLGLAAFWLYVPVFFLFYVGHPALLYFYGRKLDFRDAFKVKEIVRKVVSWRYGKILLFLIGVNIAFTILQISLAFTILGLLLIPTTLFVELLVYTKLISGLD